MGIKEMKDAYVAKMEAQLSEWSAKLKKSAAEGRIGYEEGKLKESQERARRKLDEIKAATDEKWEGLKAGLEQAWQELRGSDESKATSH